MGSYFSKEQQGLSGDDVAGNGREAQAPQSTVLALTKSSADNPFQALTDALFGKLLFRESPKRAPKLFGKIVDPGDVQHGIGPTWRNAEHPDSLLDGFKEASDPKLREVETMWEAFEYSVSNYPNYPLHGRLMPRTGKSDELEWEWSSYKEVAERIDRFATGLEKLQLFKKDKFGRCRVLGIIGPNSPEYIVAEYSCFRQGGTTVPMYSTLDPESLAYVLNLAEVGTVVASVSCARKLVDVAKDCPHLKNIVVFADTPHEFDRTVMDSAEAARSVLPKDLVEKGKAVKVEIRSFQEVERIGFEGLVDPKPPKADDIFTFIFTSGTTGPPKGALISQHAMVTNTAAILFEANKYPETRLLPGKEVELSYLPLAHAMERTVQCVVLLSGGRTGFSRGDPKLIMEDIALLRPTFFPSVPRLLNKLADKVQSGAAAAGGLKAKLFHAGVKAKMANLEKGYLKHPLWDRLIFKKITKKLGLDRCKWVPTGSAPIPGYTLNFLRILLRCPVSEAYGQSEVTCVATATHVFHFSHSHVGAPGLCAEVRLESVPDMQYFVTDTKHGKEGQQIEVVGRGEICIRGPCVMKEYYDEAEKTKDTISQDGWLKTGDIGAFLPNGTLKIIDRKKNIFKLSQGEYVEPEKIENTMVRSAFVAQTFVHSTTMHSFLVAVIVPDEDVLLPWAKKEGLPNADSFEEVVKNPKAQQLIEEDILTTCRAEGLRGFEIPRKYHFESVIFDPSNILTPTFKMARNKAQTQYESVLEQLLGPPS